MKRNIVVSVVSGFFGSALLLILLSAAGSVGAALYKADRVDGAEVRLARSVLRANAVGATTVDSAGDVGQYTSLTTGADGLGLISYRDATNGTLKVLHCGNPACSSGNISTTVDSAGDVGIYTSITIGADGLGLISYLDDFPNQDLKVLHCGNAACNSGNTATTVDSAGDVGHFNSITTGADGLGLISYRDATNGDLKVLHCGNPVCSSGNTATTVDRAGNVGFYTSLTSDADGLGLISYRDAINGALKALHCGNAACSSGNISTTVDSAGVVGEYSSITLGADGLGLISYYDAFPNFDLKVLHCGNLICKPYNIYLPLALKNF